MSDAASSDDADISQPPTPNIGGKPTIDMQTLKNIAFEEPSYLGPDGYLVTPEYLVTKHTGEATRI